MRVKALALGALACLTSLTSAQEAETFKYEVRPELESMLSLSAASAPLAQMDRLPLWSGLVLSGL